MLKVKQFEFNPFGELTYVVSDEVSREAVVIDPGMVSAAEQRRLDDYIESEGLKLTGVINTHMHLDHCFGANYVRSRYGVPVRAHVADAPLATGISEQARRFGMVIDTDSVEIDAPLADGDRIALGDDFLEVIHVPGHSPGGLAFYSPSGKFVIAGDSLFAGSVGRTDLPGGDHDTLITSVRDRLLSLPPDTLVLSGHGPATTIERERSYNPFF